MTRVVPTECWNLFKVQDASRRERLLNPPAPEELLAAVVREAGQCARDGEVHCEFESSCEKVGYSRIWATFAISATTFDQLFNGRSGYRAQYYLSPEEGVLYNRRIVEGLIEPLSIAYRSRQPRLEESFDEAEQSLRAPHSKIWIYKEREAFDDAEPYLLNPARWVENGVDRGRRIPLPSHRRIDLKGAFIHRQSGELFIDPYKEDRACDLYRKGYT